MDNSLPTEPNEKRYFDVEIPIIGSENPFLLCSCTTVEAVQAVVGAILRPDSRGPVHVKIGVRRQ